MRKIFLFAMTVFITGIGACNQETKTTSNKNAEAASEDRKSTNTNKCIYEGPYVSPLPASENFKGLDTNKLLLEEVKSSNPGAYRIHILVSESKPVTIRKAISILRKRAESGKDRDEGVDMIFYGARLSKLRCDLVNEGILKEK